MVKPLGLLFLQNLVDTGEVVAGMEHLSLIIQQIKSVKVSSDCQQCMTRAYKIIPFLLSTYKSCEFIIVSILIIGQWACVNAYTWKFLDLVSA